MTNSIQVKIKKLRENALLPAYATEGSAAVDLHAAIEAALTIEPGDRAFVPTGIAIAPETSGVVALVCARSGLACKHGLALANGVGVIDSDYRGEISVCLINQSEESYTIKPDERIAQMMFVPTLYAAFIPTDTLDETERGSGGFGSTGNV